MNSDIACLECGSSMVVITVEVDDKAWVCSNPKCVAFDKVP